MPQYGPQTTGGSGGAYASTGGEPVSRIQPSIVRQGIPQYGPQTTGGGGGAHASTGGEPFSRIQPSIVGPLMSQYGPQTTGVGGGGVYPSAGGEAVSRIQPSIVGQLMPQYGPQTTGGGGGAQASTGGELLSRIQSTIVGQLMPQYGPQTTGGGAHASTGGEPVSPTLPAIVGPLMPQYGPQTTGGGAHASAGGEPFSRIQPSIVGPLMSQYGPQTTAGVGAHASTGGEPVSRKQPVSAGQPILQYGPQTTGVGGEDARGGGEDARGGGENRGEGNTMGQTVNEESMDVKKDNQEKTTHSSTSSVQRNYFDWDKYLKETGSISAPSEYFRQSKIPPTNEFQVGMKLEARDPRNIASVCVASVIATTGARLRLRLDGTDNKNDFWRLVDSSDIQPVGTCEQEGDLLQPPLGYRMNVSSWPMFLLRTLTGSELAPAGFFKKEPPPPPLNNFKVGMKIEAVDRKNPFLICPATIGAVRGDQIHITFDGWSGTFDYWCKYDSRDIFPVGWCCLTGDVLQPPGNIAERKPRSKAVTKPWKDGATALESEEAAPEAEENPKDSVFTNPFEDEDRPVKDDQAATAGKKPKGRGFTKPGKDEARPGKDNQATPAGKKPKGRGITKTWEEARPGKDVQAAPAGKKPKGRGFTKPWEEARPGKDVQAAPVESKPKSKRVTKPWKEQATPFEDEAEAPAKKKPRGKTVTKPRKDQTELFEYEEAAPAKKKPKAKTVTKPWKDQAGHFEYEEPAAPATKKHKGKKVTKPWTDQAGLFEYEEAGPAEKKRKGKKVTKPWKDQTGLFEDEEAGPAKKKRKGKTVTKTSKDQAGLFEYEEPAPGEKKRKGKTVIKPQKDQAGIFEYEEAVPGKKKRKDKRVSKFWEDQAKLLEDEEAIPALFSALSVKSAENTPPSSYEQTKTPTSEKKKSSTSKGAQSPKKKSPQKTTLVLPVPKTSKKSGKTKPTGDTSATTKGTCKTVLPKEKGRKSWVKEKCIPVISSTSTASLSSLIRRSSSNKSPVGPSKIVMSTVCVYINKHGDCGPYLNPQKVQQLPDHFGPGPVNVILRRIVQACVDCAIDSKTVFLFIKPDNRGGEVITAFFDEKVHSVQLPPVNSASFALRFLENFCRSMQCDKFLSSQPFKPKAHIPTSTTDLDQSKPALNEELKGSRRLKRCSQRPLTFAPVSSKVPRKSGRASKASSYIAVPDPSVLKQGFCKDPSTWSVDEVIQFMKHTDPHIAGPLADLFRQHEIDGKALLLLKSELMMKYMGLKLGPALKLCYYIEKLKEIKYN
ncbi:sex comb on midleg-like protein 2 isoform X4 [Microtus pennsylvanicus]|uniref:sex comb on midleg-like protein 2 isoform X4 n=1 Tax=Microtus pennsylvanicus TaxID=10058 RepID=UPI003F6C8614